jgi:hypothetical protein
MSDGKKSIQEMCGVCAQRTVRVEEIVIKQGAMEHRQDGFDQRLSEMEKTNKQLDRIEAMLAEALKKTI